MWQINLPSTRSLLRDCKLKEMCKFYHWQALCWCLNTELKWKTSCLLPVVMWNNFKLSYKNFSNNKPGIINCFIFSGGINIKYTKKYSPLTWQKSYNDLYLRHPCSSDPSGQSSSPSHRQWPWMQCPSAQWNIFAEQVDGRDVTFPQPVSSDPSEQSSSPSHLQRVGMHCWFPQVNWFELQVLEAAIQR